MPDTKISLYPDGTPFTSADELVIARSGANYHIPLSTFIFSDNLAVLLGTGSDLELFHDGTNSYIQNNTGDIIIENDAADEDIIFKVNDGGVDTTLMTLDGSASRIGIGITAPLAKLQIAGTEDEIQLIVKGNATQTANLMEWHDSAGSVLASISGTGKMVFTFTVTDAIATHNVIIVNHTATATGGADAQLHRLFTGSLTLQGTQNFTNVSNAAYNMTAYHNGSGAITALYSLRAASGCLSTGGITTLNIIDVSVYGSGGVGVITSLAMVNIANMTAYNTPVTAMGLYVRESSNAVGTSKYGVFIENISGAVTNNFAIRTLAGDITFNDGGDADTDFRVESDAYDAVFIDASNDSIMLMSNTAGKVGFYGVAAIAQAVLATGTGKTVDNVITFLQLIGLCKQA